MRKLAGITPITTFCLPATSMRLPIADGSPPKCRCQNAYPISATLFAPGTSSSGRKSRPSIGATPSAQRLLRDLRGVHALGIACAGDALAFARRRPRGRRSAART